jgi:hypothetical protein
MMLHHNVNVMNIEVTTHSSLHLVDLDKQATLYLSKAINEPIPSSKPLEQHIGQSNPLRRLSHYAPSTQDQPRQPAQCGRGQMDRVEED